MLPTWLGSVFFCLFIWGGRGGALGLFWTRRGLQRFGALGVRVPGSGAWSLELRDGFGSRNSDSADEVSQSLSVHQHIDNRS